MTEFISFEPGIKAKGAAAMLLVPDTVNSLVKIDILRENGLRELNPDGWYDLQMILDSSKKLIKAAPEVNLFVSGKKVIDEVPFPPMSDLKNALESIDIAYHMNHMKEGQPMFDDETGDMLEGIGHYKLTKFDEENRFAELTCHTPYPSKMVEGLIVQIVRKFKPKGSVRNKVKLNKYKESRVSGGEKWIFNISW